MRTIDADYVISALSIFNDREHGSEHFIYGIETAKEIVGNAPTIGGWINVKDRLPEKEGRYLVLTSGIFGIKIAMFTMSLKRHFDYMFEDGEPDRPGFYDWDSEDDWIEDGVTHWMDLPALPKGEGTT